MSTKQNAPGELSVKEDDILLVFDKEDAWLLVQSQAEGGKAGFVPEKLRRGAHNIFYVSSRQNIDYSIRRQLLNEDGDAPTSLGGIVVPPSVRYALFHMLNHTKPIW